MELKVYRSTEVMVACQQRCILEPRVGTTNIGLGCSIRRQQRQVKCCLSIGDILTLLRSTTLSTSCPLRVRLTIGERQTDCRQFGPARSPSAWPDVLAGPGRAPCGRHLPGDSRRVGGPRNQPGAGDRADPGADRDGPAWPESAGNGRGGYGAAPGDVTENRLPRRRLYSSFGAPHV